MKIANHRRLWIWCVLVSLPALLAMDALMGLAYRANTNANVKIIVPHSCTATLRSSQYKAEIGSDCPLWSISREAVRAMIATGS
jgi:hypothetical protein